MALDAHIRVGLVTLIAAIFIPWLITDPHWRNVLLGFLGLYVLYVMTERAEMHQPGKKAVLITGCDSGFGHGMATYFDRQGFRVFAGCLVSEGEGAKTLQSACSERLKVLQLDVTKDEQVTDALEVVKEDLDGKGLWGLVNNAGILQFAEVELSPLSEFQHHFDVNCMGQIRMVKAFLPLIQRAKGRIVNFSSLMARMYMSMFSAYCISKVGVEMFSHVLRLEMLKWGVKVATIYPSGFDTNLTRFSVRQEKFMEEIKGTLNKSQRTYYNDMYFRKVLERSGRAEKTPSGSIAKRYGLSSDYSMVFQAVDDALLSHSPQANYLVGFGAYTTMMVMSICPYWLLDIILTLSTYTHREKHLEPVVNMKFE